jgi:putative heme-binding domain-containing protein
MRAVLRYKFATVAAITLMIGAAWYIDSRHVGAENFWKRKYYTLRNDLSSSLSDEWYRTWHTRLGIGAEGGKALYGEFCSSCHQPGGRGSNLQVAVLPRASTDEALARIIRHGIPSTDMRGSALTDPEVWQLVAYVRKLGKSGSRSTQAGDPRNGRLLVHSEKGRCLSCHSVRGEGAFDGPDLTRVGLRRTPSYLRESLINPSSDIAKEYAIVTARTANQTISGMRLAEDTFNVVLRDRTGVVHSLPKSDITTLTEARLSPMPTYSWLSQKDLDDTLAYLVSLQ